MGREGRVAIRLVAVFKDSRHPSCPIISEQLSGNEEGLLLAMARNNLLPAQARHQLACFDFVAVVVMSNWLI